MYSANDPDAYHKSPVTPPPLYGQPPPPPYGQPAATGYPLQQHIETPWSSGLCDCCSDCPNCCITYWCPCVTFGQIAEIVDEGSTSCGVSGALYAAITYLTCCGCIYSSCYRSKMRAKYNLHQSPCNDCCVHFCCESCALCQEYRELKNKGFNMSLGWQGNIDRQDRGSLAMGPPPTAPVMGAGMMR